MTDMSSGFNQDSGKTDADEAKRRLRRMMQEKKFFEDKAAEYRNALQSRQTQARLDLDRRHDVQNNKLGKKLHDAYAADEAKNKEALKAVQAKEKQSSADKDKAQALQRTLADIQKRKKEQQDTLQKRQDQDKKTLAEKQDAESKTVERAISDARQDRQSKGWKPEPVVFDKFKSQDNRISFQKPAKSSSESLGGSQTGQTTPDSLSGSPKPYLAPKGASTGNLRPSETKQDKQTDTGRGSGNGMGM